MRSYNKVQPASTKRKYRPALARVAAPVRGDSSLMGRIITHSVLATTDNQVDTIYGAALELGCVEEAEDPRHRQLRRRQEEGAEDRNRHHQVKVDEQV